MAVHHSSAVLFLVFVHLLGGATSFPEWDHNNNESNYTKNKKLFPAANEEYKFRSSAVFGVHGSVYPQGYFYTQIPIGYPAQYLNLDIDTGSELTWINCEGSKNIVVVRCNDPLCPLVQHPPKFPCRRPSDPCYYRVRYADGGTSTGSLVKENLPIQLRNGSKVNPLINIGCGQYRGSHSQSSSSPFGHGVLGLANTKVSILSQLSEMGITRNVIGHCLGTSNTGYLFFGNDLVPRSGVVWVPMSKNHGGVGKHYYSLGPADLTFDGGKKVIISDLPLILDSGSTYTYFNAEPYNALLATIEKTMDLRLKRVPGGDDDTLPVCWKGPNKFTSINDAIPFYNNLALRFPRSGNVGILELEMPPPSYLIISEKGNACLGILHGTPGGVGLNIIGDISLLDKLVIYDNERHLIGWTPTKCRGPKKL